MKVQTSALCLAATLILVSCDNSSQRHSHDTNQALTTKEGVWPPELTDTSNQQVYPAVLRNRVRGSIVAAARESVLNNPSVRSALGSNYREYDASLTGIKSDVIASFLFFNYANNSTVEADLLTTGAVTVNIFDAADFQPAENSTEVSEAIELGLSSLSDAGLDLTSLEGTAMLAHPNELAPSGSQYFNERILYVTFGQGSGELPDYSALVNLSTSPVLNFGQLR